MKDDEIRDLAPLSPRRDAEQWRRMTAAIEAAAAPELARRAALAPPGVLELLASWLRPAGSVAFSFGAAAALLLIFAAPSTDSAIPSGVADGLGYPDAVSAWIEAGRTPSVEELLVTLQTETR